MHDDERKRDESSAGRKPPPGARFRIRARTTRIYNRLGNKFRKQIAVREGEQRDAPRGKLAAVYSKLVRATCSCQM